MIFDANYKDEVWEIPFINVSLSKRIVAYIAAGGMILAGLLGLLFSFIDLFKWGMDISFFKVFLFNVMELGFAALIIWDRKNIIFPAAKVISLIFSGLSAFIGLFGRIAFVYWLNVRFAAAIVDLLLLVMLIVTMFDYFEKYREYVRKFWFIPSAILFLTNVIFFFVTVRSFRWNWTGYLENLMAFIAVTGFSFWIANTAYAPLMINGKDVWVLICEKVKAYRERPKAQPVQPMQQGQPVQPPVQEFSGQVPYEANPMPQQGGYQGQVPPQGSGMSKPAGHIDMAMHILLLFLTCGIWQIIWMYKVTEHLNGYCKGYPVRTSGVEVILSLIIPFYWVFWTYQTGKRIDAMGLEVGVASDVTVIGLISCFFMPIISVILYQSKVNEIAVKRGY